MARSVPVLVLAYFGGTLAATLGAGAPFTAVAVLCLVSAVLLPALARRRAAAWITWLGATALLATCVASGRARLPGYLAPPLILGTVAGLFGHSLGRGHTPLIARFIYVIDGPAALDDPAVARYARGLTRLWTLLPLGMALFAGLAALCVVPDGVLAAFGIDPPRALDAGSWSLLVNVGGYALLASAFVGELLLRPWLLPQAPRHGLVDFARRVIAAWPALRGS